MEALWRGRRNRGKSRSVIQEVGYLLDDTLQFPALQFHAQETAASKLAVPKASLIF